MPTITYKKQGDITIHLHDGVKKYEHYKNSNGDESWHEYDEKGNLIHVKDNNGYEWWRDTHSDNPKSRPIESDSEPFTFSK